MSQISIRSLTFAHPGGEELFSNWSAQLDTSWKLAVVGRNGMGKSTLFGLLQGRWPFQGQIVTAAQFRSFPAAVEDGWQTGWQVAQQLCPGLAQWQLEKQLHQLSMQPETIWQPWDTLSPGMQTKLQLAALMLGDGCLLIDEPTNHLDADGRRVLAEFLRRSRAGYFLISHDREFLCACTDHTLVLLPGGPMLVAGGYGEYQKQKARIDREKQERNKKLSRDIDRLRESARRTACWSQKAEAAKKGQGQNSASGLRPDRGYLGHKAAKMMQQAQNIQTRRQRAIEEKAGLLQDVDTAEALCLRPLGWDGRPVLRLEQAQPFRDGAPVCAPVDLLLHSGQRIAVEGVNGAGKTSLLQMAAGQLSGAGRAAIAQGAVVSVMSQTVRGLQGSLSGLCADHDIDRTRLLTILRKLDFPRELFGRDLASYSDGQKKKVLLAASLCCPAHLYIWDEPLNYIDLPSREQIEQMILQAQPTMLFVEHDAAFVRAVATPRVRLYTAEP